jgi:hypothetical protein
MAQPAIKKTTSQGSGTQARVSPGSYAQTQGHHDVVHAKGDLVYIRVLARMSTGTIDYIAPMQVLRRHGPKTLLVGLPGFPKADMLFDEQTGECTRGNTDTHTYVLTGANALTR